jgi:hypothetical protein
MVMEPTTVIFVHGFDSDPDYWKTMRKALEKDGELEARGYKLVWTFSYPTKFLELLPTKRIPSVMECGSYLADFVERNAPDGRIMLVGHSMGGLVIQAYLAKKIIDKRAPDLQRILTVVTFATPNRGSTILSTMRNIFTWLSDNPQDKELMVLNKEIADTSETIVRSVLGAEGLDATSCPIPFRVFWGMEDKIVPEVSACGPFVEASPLPGGHSEILQPDPAKPDDPRLLEMKSALLDPVGHPAIYELDLWETNLTVSPNDPSKVIPLHGFDDPIQVQTDNVATRDMQFVFSRQNRCAKPWDQMYRSKQGFVRMLSLTGTNEASDAEMSEYVETAKRFTYVFTPVITSSQTQTYAERLKIYNGFGDGQRNWHDHLKPNARCRLYRFVLNLKDFGNAGYTLTSPPALHFLDQDVMDHSLCDSCDGRDPLPPLQSDDPWVSTWEIENVHGGVVDLEWDVKKPA